MQEGEEGQKELGSTTLQSATCIRITACVREADDRQKCDPSARNQSHVGRVRFPLRAEMHGRGHITDSCFIAFITSKIC